MDEGCGFRAPGWMTSRMSAGSGVKFHVLRCFSLELSTQAQSDWHQGCGIADLLAPCGFVGHRAARSKSLVDLNRIVEISDRSQADSHTALNLQSKPLWE